MYGVDLHTSGRGELDQCLQVCRLAGEAIQMPHHDRHPLRSSGTVQECGEPGTFGSPIGGASLVDELRPRGEPKGSREAGAILALPFDAARPATRRGEPQVDQTDRVDVVETGYLAQVTPTLDRSIDRPGLPGATVTRSMKNRT